MSTDDILAANEFRDSIIHKRDGFINGHFPYFHGWVIVDSFLAGIKSARAAKREKTMSLKLGQKARDTITGFTGILVARTEWLYGCIRWTLQPQDMKDGKPIEQYTFDEPQLEPVLDEKQSIAQILQPGGPVPNPKQHPGPTR